jgi:hypothetical protein
MGVARAAVAADQVGGLPTGGLGQSGPKGVLLVPVHVDGGDDGVVDPVDGGGGGRHPADELVADGPARDGEEDLDTGRSPVEPEGSDHAELGQAPTEVRIVDGRDRGAEICFAGGHGFPPESVGRWHDQDLRRAWQVD